LHESAFFIIANDDLHRFADIGAIWAEGDAYLDLPFFLIRLISKPYISGIENGCISEEIKTIFFESILIFISPTSISIPSLPGFYDDDIRDFCVYRLL